MATTRDDVQDATGQRTNIPGQGYMRGFGTGAQYQVTANTVNNVKGNPINGEVGWAPGATFQNPYTAVIGNFLWVNIGTNLSALWLNVDGPTFFGVTTPAVVNLTASTLAVTAALHAGRIITVNRAGGTAITLPSPTGTGNKYSFFVGTTITSGVITVDAKAADASAVFAGNAYITGATGAITAFVTASNSNELSFAFTTVGAGNLGDQIDVQDIGLHLWSVTIFSSDTGTAASPFINH